MLSLSMRFLLVLFLANAIARPASADLNDLFGDAGWATVPPRGWNSYDSYSWVISEDDFMENVELVSKYLRAFGYQYVVVDALWYRSYEPKTTSSYINDTIDVWGRPQPDPDRWPSSRDGKGFRDVADRVHELGLKFGIQVMRGIHKLAVERNTPIFRAQGRKKKWRARDIAILGEDCSFMPDCFMGVDVRSEGGKLFLTSLYRQYADWGVDFIKHDCIFGEKELLLDEIRAVAQAILQTGRSIVYSVSPGDNATPVMAAAVANITNMYRVSRGVWDTWYDVEPHFTIARDFAASGLLGVSGLGGGGSWPDLDVLPLGWLGDPGTDNVAYRATRLTDSEQKSQITLWAIAKSPMMFGGDMRHLDQPTLDILTNPAILDINSHSFGNTEVIRFATGGVKMAECSSMNNTNWRLSNSTQICWHRKNHTVCFNWRPFPRRNQIDPSYLGQVRTGRRDREEVCLDAVASKSSRQHPGKHFSTCKGHRSQTWRLNSTGHLVNERLGTCAIVVEDDDATRIWVAYGSSGQVYVAFFNASPKKTQMSIPLDELLDEYYSTIATVGNNSVDMIFSPHNKTRWRCFGEEVWSGKKIVETEAVSFKVDGHGCALFVFSCNYNLRGRDVRMLSRVLLASFLSIVGILALVNLARYCWQSRQRK